MFLIIENLSFNTFNVFKTGDEDKNIKYVIWHSGAVKLPPTGSLLTAERGVNLSSIKILFHKTLKAQFNL